MPRIHPLTTTLVAAPCLCLPAIAQQVSTPHSASPTLAAPAVAGRGHWVASWATSLQALESAGHGDAVDPALLTDATVRQIVHLSAGGPELRLQLANTFGTGALAIDAVHVAVARSTATAAIDPATDHAVTFAGKPSVSIPPGAVYLSDPIEMTVPNLTNLAVSLHLASPPQGQSFHSDSEQNSFLLHGDHTAEADLPEATKVAHWMNLGEVDVRATGASLVCFGDSITDGYKSTPGGNDRWPDTLAAHFAEASNLPLWGVVNEGISGNHLLTNNAGENALARFDRDVLATPDLKVVVLLEGINDIGKLAGKANSTPADHAQLVAALEAAITQIVQRAHDHGVHVIGATLTPFSNNIYYHPDAAGEADRVALNDWIRQPNHVDGFVDFDAVVRDPKSPTQMLPAFDSGDHLHPGPAGYKAMGDAMWAFLSK